jgi:hypothetical protein
MVQRVFRQRYWIDPPLAKTFVVGMNIFKIQGVYVRGRVQGDHTLRQRKMCTEFKRLFSEARKSPLVVLAT